MQGDDFLIWIKALSKFRPPCSQMFLKSSLQTLSKMRTNKNKLETKIEKEPTMIRLIKTAATRSSDTLLGDAFGAAALMVMLVGALYLPGLN